MPLLCPMPGSDAWDHRSPRRPALQRPKVKKAKQSKRQLDRIGRPAGAMQCSAVQSTTVSIVVVHLAPARRPAGFVSLVYLAHTHSYGGTRS